MEYLDNNTKEYLSRTNKTGKIVGMFPKVIDEQDYDELQIVESERQKSPNRYSNRKKDKIKLMNLELESRI